MNAHHDSDGTAGTVFGPRRAVHRTAWFRRRLPPVGIGSSGSISTRRDGSLPPVRTKLTRQHDSRRSEGYFLTLLARAGGAAEAGSIPREAFRAAWNVERAAQNSAPHRRERKVGASSPTRGWCADSVDASRTAPRYRADKVDASTCSSHCRGDSVDASTSAPRYRGDDVDASRCSSHCREVEVDASTSARTYRRDDLAASRMSARSLESDLDASKMSPKYPRRRAPPSASLVSGGGATDSGYPDPAGGVIGSGAAPAPSPARGAGRSPACPRTVQQVYDARGGPVLVQQDR